MKTGDRRVKKETRNDKRRRGRARKAQERSQDPEQPRDDAHVQTGHGKQMQSAGLLKWFLNVVRRFVAQTERHTVDQGGYSRRILQAARDCRSHPSPRASRRAPDRIASVDVQDRPVFRITDENAIEDILSREILRGGRRPRDYAAAKWARRFR